MKKKIRDPLLKPLPYLAELETQMNLFIGVNQAHGEWTRGRPLQVFRDVSRVCLGLPCAPAAATKILHRVPRRQPFAVFWPRMAMLGKHGIEYLAGRQGVDRNNRVNRCLQIRLW
jgi:hypothetical protein